LSDILVHADVGRTGLGNMLFPWARAEVFARRVGAAMLAPKWTQPKIGPLLRGERDLRYYSGLFDNSSYVRGPRRALELLRRRRVEGASIGINVDPRALPASCDGALVTFQGYEGWFRDDLYPHRQLIHRRLESIITDRVRNEIQAFDKPLLMAVHVRRGDMRRDLLQPGQAMPTGNENVVASEYYFLTLIRLIRQDCGRELPVTVFTDAREGELSELLAEKGVQFAGARSAIADILLMSRAAVLIASSASSFSAWASFLGAMPTVWDRGRVGCTFPDRPDLAIESDAHGRIGEPQRGLIQSTIEAASTGAADPSALAR
jgi:hypothetical protein